jgi:transcriptional regulator with XRE-family HTH domain
MGTSVLGPRLAECRKKKNLSQLQVAEAVHLNRATISAHEKNTICPSVETLGKLARLYGVSVDYLLGNDAGNAESRRQDQLLILCALRTRLREAERLLNELEAKIDQ